MLKIKDLTLQLRINDRANRRNCYIFRTVLNRNGPPVSRQPANIPEMGRFWGAMDSALEAITNGLQSPKDALNGAAARMLAK